MTIVVDTQGIPTKDRPLRLTRALAEQVCGLRLSEMPADVLERARHAILDYIACAVAGAQDETARIVLADALEDGGGDCSIIGHSALLAPLQAALVNGTAGHALDYDDCLLVLPGHLSVAILPALFAAAERRGSNGAELMTAFVAGFELGGRIGRMVAPSHYARGYHATATIGAIAAAGACARLVGLSGEQTAHALGIAATQSAGLKGMFGTMCKPLHAGKAAQTGLLSARLANRGFEGGEEPLTGPAGFAEVMAAPCSPEKAFEPPPNGFYIRDNLFKYHASCYGTQGAIEAAKKAAAEIAQGAEIIRCIVRVGVENRSICAIEVPRTANEAKFSVRQMVAFALAGLDTSSLQTFTDSRVREPTITRLRDRVEVIFDSQLTMTQARLELYNGIGSRILAEHDAGVPGADLPDQGSKLSKKFLALVNPVMGAQRAGQILDQLSRLETSRSLRKLTQLLRSPMAR